MEEEAASECRRDWRAAAVRCAVVLGVSALLVSLATLTLVLTGRQEHPESLVEPCRIPGDLQESQGCVRTFYVGSLTIENGTMKWINSDTARCAQELVYDNKSGMLSIKSEGWYHISAWMGTRCLLSECTKQDNATFIVHHKTAHNSGPILSLSFHLSPRLNKTFSTSMNVSFQLKENDALYVTSKRSTELSGWQLDKNSFLKISKISGNSHLQVVTSENRG